MPSNNNNTVAVDRYIWCWVLRNVTFCHMTSVGVCVCCIYASASMNIGVSRQIHAGVLVCAHFGCRSQSGESTVASGVITLVHRLYIIIMYFSTIYNFIVHSTLYIGARYLY